MAQPTRSVAVSIPRMSTPKVCRISPPLPTRERRGAARSARANPDHWRRPSAGVARGLGEFGGAQFSTFKAALVDLAVAKLAPINAEMKRLVADPVYIDSVLADGAARAQVVAADTMKAVKDIVGFVRR